MGLKSCGQLACAVVPRARQHDHRRRRVSGHRTDLAHQHAVHAHMASMALAMPWTDTRGLASRAWVVNSNRRESTQVAAPLLVQPNCEGCGLMAWPHVQIHGTTVASCRPDGAAPPPDAVAIDERPERTASRIGGEHRTGQRVDLDALLGPLVWPWLLQRRLALGALDRGRGVQLPPGMRPRHRGIGLSHRQHRMHMRRRGARDGGRPTRPCPTELACPIRHPGVGGGCRRAASGRTRCTTPWRRSTGCR